MLSQSEWDLAHGVTRTSSEEEHLRVEGETVQALLRKEVLCGLGRVHLAAALRVADVRRDEKVHDGAEDIAHDASPPRAIHDRSRDVTGCDRDVGAGIQCTDKDVDDVDRDGEVSI